ncbi:mycothiol synthase [Mobilicoccus pelagius]|uniref:Mycothiol acetyltransferase n=1 Tax=Mobilicoccus pelagius NBRC 104925 TaxID=1089455 RepID=H5UN43_9MICO|nr:mycothiol synthase [Mobilicoccus pelagius]GAB47151.1 acetyltransferase MshD [Mobilicoccus pelagius NBRC 104925]
MTDPDTPRTTASVHKATTLTGDRDEDVRRLARRAAEVDGVDALSEQTFLHLGAPAGAHRHLVAETPDGRVVGYAHLDHTDPEAGVEIVVDPDLRRQGHGTRLWEAVTALVPDARVWAHGNLPAAQAWARDTGLHVVRELLRMARPLEGLADATVDLPEGYRARTFTFDDVDAWVALNGRAFATHPEQGRVTADDVRARAAEPWFDPAGLFLVEDPDSRLVAFHWTKTEDDEGEVYVVGVDPDRQGLGLGKAATLLGLRHLARQGLPRVTLYVDGDNTAALATYGRLGFERISLDVQYGA